MRHFSILLAPLLLLAGYAAGRFTATPAPFVAAQDSFAAPAEGPDTSRITRAPTASNVESAVFASNDDAFGPPPPPFARQVAQAAPRKSPPTQILDDDPFGSGTTREKTAPKFIPTPFAVQTEQEVKYLNAALKVFRGLGETERQAEFEQMIGRMEEQDAAAELLRLRTELQQLSEKYPKTGAGKKALEAIQTLPVVNVPEAGHLLDAPDLGN